MGVVGVFSLVGVRFSISTNTWENGLLAICSISTNRRYRNTKQKIDKLISILSIGSSVKFGEGLIIKYVFDIFSAGWPGLPRRYSLSSNLAYFQT